MKHMSAVIREVKIPEGVVRVSIAITIMDSSNRFVISRFDNEHGQFYNINPNPKLNIRIKINDVPWNPTHQISIGQNDFEEFRSSLKYFYKSLMSSNNIYIYDEGGNLTNVAVETIDIFQFATFTNQSMSIQPDMVTDKGINIPGVRLTLNRPDVTSLLSITEFESIYKEIENMSLFDRGMVLLNAFLAFSKINPEMMMLSTQDTSPPKTTNPNNSKGIFDETVKGPPARQKPKSLFDL